MTAHTITNAEVASLVGVTPGAVSRWRTATTKAGRHPSFDAMTKIADIFDFSTTDQMELAHFGKPGAYAAKLEEHLRRYAAKQAELESEGSKA